MIKDLVMTLPTNRSIPDLFSDALGQLAKLIGNEFDLARAELAEKMAQAGRAITFIASGAALAIPALVLLLLACAAALISSGFSNAVAYLIVGGITAIASAALIGTGMSRMSGEALKPKLTRNQLQQDKNAAKEIMK
jgi:uncharacterized membrane protein